MNGSFSVTAQYQLKPMLSSYMKEMHIIDKYGCNQWNEYQLIFDLYSYPKVSVDSCCLYPFLRVLKIPRCGLLC
jgi:hypothetical protein